jgi:cell wall assembly regulator SMI1
MRIPLVGKSWRDSGIAIRPGVAQADIDTFELSHGVHLPDEMAEYFRLIDGMNEGSADEHGIRFWPLVEVRAVLEEIPKASKDLFDGYFVFADYSLWAHGYAVHLIEGKSDVIIAGGETPFKVAASFGEFLELYINNPEMLFKR